MNNSHSPYIYLRVLRHVDHTVFAVQNGQKFYYDSQFKVKIAYSSGQQVKRSILETLISNLNISFGEIVFHKYLLVNGPKNIEKAVHKEGIAQMSCDPSYPDQLIGGYMLAESGNKKNPKKKNAITEMDVEEDGESTESNAKESDTSVVKRRSPLSISAMRPLHPLLGGLEWQEEILTFDRTNIPGASVKVFWKVGKELGDEVSPEDLQEWLTTHNKSLPARKLVKEQTRASGLFIFDVAIDLRTLFCVSLDPFEREITPQIETKLSSSGWIKGRNAFGACLICPASERAKIIPALAHALLNWRITSNQSRTFSPMETLAVAISDNANQITYAIRGELKEDTGERLEAVAKLDETARAQLFVTPVCSGYIPGASGSADALDRAAEHLEALLKAYDPEKP